MQGDQITELRVMLGEAIDDESDESSSLFTDDQLSKWIDSSETLEDAAVKGWRSKMAHYSNLVNVTDGAASREMSDLLTNAATMYKIYIGLAKGPTAGRTRVGKIVRS